MNKDSGLYTGHSVYDHTGRSVYGHTGLSVYGHTGCSVYGHAGLSVYQATHSGTLKKLSRKVSRASLVVFFLDQPIHTYACQDFFFTTFLSGGSEIEDSVREAKRSNAFDPSWEYPRDSSLEIDRREPDLAGLLLLRSDR